MCNAGLIRAVILLLLLPPALRGQTTAPSLDLTKAALSGGELAPEAVKRLEAELKESPDALAKRAQVLGFYFTQRLSSDAAKKARMPHVLWMIENAPANDLTGTPYCHALKEYEPELYDRGKAAWAKHTTAEQRDAEVLGNAAAFFTSTDSKAAIELLNRAAALDPANAAWPKRLAHQHQLEARAATGEAAAELLVAALRHQTKALELSSTAEDRFYMLTDMPELALSAGRPDEAAAHANALLEMAGKFRRDWNYGNAIHDANLALGHVALAKGDVQAAKDHLLAAGRTPGSPQLGSFGPDMSLAKALLEKGERDAVIEYLKLCGKFWKMGRERLKLWTKTLQSGGTPTFDERG